MSLYNFIENQSNPIKNVLLLRFHAGHFYSLSVIHYKSFINSMSNRTRTQNWRKGRRNRLWRTIFWFAILQDFKKSTPSVRWTQYSCLNITVSVLHKFVHVVSLVYDIMFNFFTTSVVTFNGRCYLCRGATSFFRKKNVCHPTNKGDFFVGCSVPYNYLLFDILFITCSEDSGTGKWASMRLSCFDTIR